MSKKPKQRKAEIPKGGSAKNRSGSGVLWRSISIATLVIALVAAVFFLASTGGFSTRNKQAPGGPLTFSRDIAPIVFQNCSECHRPGQSAPFSLLTYADVKKHSTDISDVVGRRYMPPWLPDNPPGEFKDDRRLKAEEIEMIQKWVAGGAPEGNSAETPPVPEWKSDWQLGPPDLVVTMPDAYVLPAAGSDVYRNFVLPTRLDRPRYIRALEFRPSSKVVHHAFVRFDRTGKCRVLDEKEPGPGFGGMETPATAETPPGHFTGWVPGASPSRAPDGLAWQLPAEADLVVLLHMQCSGKTESVQPSVGIYFTETPPTNTPVVMNLQAFGIDIAPGETDKTVEEFFTLPVAAELLAIKPHTHFLGKRLTGLAALPNGSTRTLLSIPQWDFNWQTDYKYRTPIKLPAGTMLKLRYSFDNSTNNVKNPHRPPQRVKYGLASSDEMAELTFQLLPGRDDVSALGNAVARYSFSKAVEMQQIAVRDNPTNFEAIAQLGKLLHAQGNIAAAEAFLRRAAEFAPTTDVHYSLGIVYMDQAKNAEAEREFLAALKLDPNHFKARNNAGLCCLRQSKLDDAEAHFREVLRYRPEDAVAGQNLDLVLEAKRAGNQSK